ncbi:MAG: hypothetical protein KatS3mg103_0649 [Phycisphaerales bacterium]|nr:MAG: hypothetical protein KatS3mg103_0649 [Phycisphaerales bacterium]
MIELTPRVIEIPEAHAPTKDERDDDHDDDHKGRIY